MKGVFTGRSLHPALALHGCRPCTVGSSPHEWWTTGPIRPCASPCCARTKAHRSQGTHWLSCAQWGSVFHGGWGGLKAVLSGIGFLWSLKCRAWLQANCSLGRAQLAWAFAEGGCRARVQARLCAHPATHSRWPCTVGSVARRGWGASLAALCAMESHRTQAWGVGYSLRGLTTVKEASTGVRHHGLEACSRGTADLNKLGSAG